MQTPTYHNNISTLLGVHNREQCKNGMGNLRIKVTNRNVTDIFIMLVMCRSLIYYILKMGSK